MIGSMIIGSMMLAQQLLKGNSLLLIFFFVGKPPNFSFFIIEYESFYIILSKRTKFLLEH